MKWIRIVFLFLISVFLFHSSSILFAQSPPSQPGDSQLQNISDQINQYTQLLNQSKGQEHTLKSALDYIDAQTKLTQLKVEQTNFQIIKLDQEINDLSERINRISANVDNLSQVLLSRIVQTYKYGNVTPIDLLFSSNGFGDILERLKYIEVAQANDKKVLYQLQATKTTYNDQKTDKETRQAQEEKLKKDLDTYSAQLDADKTTKEALLRLTQNNEAIYQAKLQAALAEQQALLAIFSGNVSEVSDGMVHKGDPIGAMVSGQSGCSSGTHLHFEVHQNGITQDPNDFLSPTNFTYYDKYFGINLKDDGNDEGKISPHGPWGWPIPATIIITQGFGMTPYAQATGAYGPKGHTGIDMYYSYGLAVYAVADGQLSHGVYENCPSPYTGPLYYKRLDIGNGISIYYFHVN